MRYLPQLEVMVHPEVYPPSDDSILLILSLDVREGERVLEIGCGSGVVSMHCAVNGCEVTAVDVNPYAVDLTERNLERNGLSATVLLSDLYSNVSGRYDTIVFNLPYLPTDDEGLLAKAWSGGPDGMGPLPQLLDLAPDHLLDGGRVVVVTSSLMDAVALERTLSRYEVRNIGSLELFFEVLDVLEIRGFSRSPGPTGR